MLFFKSRPDRQLPRDVPTSNFFLTRNIEGKKCQSVQTLSTTLDPGNRIKWQVATSTNNLRRRRCVAVTPQQVASPGEIVKKPLLQRKPGWRTCGGGKPVAHAQPRVELTWLWPRPTGSQALELRSRIGVGTSMFDLLGQTSKFVEFRLQSRASHPQFFFFFSFSSLFFYTTQNFEARLQCSNSKLGTSLGTRWSGPFPSH